MPDKNDPSQRSIFRSSNPTLSDKIFDSETASSSEGTMTLMGTVDKLFILTGLMLATACYTWHLMTDPSTLAQAGAFALAGVLLGFVVGLVVCFKRSWSGFLAPIYAALQGLALGAISAMYERAYNGIVIQSLGLTIGTLLILLFAYRSRLIKVTDHLRLGIVSATGAIVLLYVAEMVLNLFGIQIPYINDAGPIGIGFSVLVVFIASMNFVLDFDFIERGCNDGAPKYMEWYGAFGLLVTLIWVYLEILKLMSKLRRR